MNADRAETGDIEGEYSKADIAHYGYVPQDLFTAPPLSNETLWMWSTLDVMIQKGERLVFFVNPLKPDIENAPYLLDEFTFLWENSYEVTNLRKLFLRG